MTNSRNSYSERHNGSTSSARPDEPRRGGIRVALRRDRRLADGMAIVAAIEARLLRMRVLSLNAVIDVVPAEAAPERGDDDRTVAASAPRRRLPRRGRAAGGDLAAASAAIGAGAEELRSARERMP